MHIVAFNMVDPVIEGGLGLEMKSVHHSKFKYDVQLSWVIFKSSPKLFLNKPVVLF